MKFEHILQIYWTKGFFYSTKLFYFSLPLKYIIYNLYGLDKKFKSLLNQRFELTFFFKNKINNIVDYNNYGNILYSSINIILSQITSVNNQINDLKKLNIIRLYLIKSYRGKAHAIGKPVKGQRTWSNSWNSYKTNKILRNFINKTKQFSNKTKLNYKLNYKLVKKKYLNKVQVNQKKNDLSLKNKNLNLWF